MKQLQAPLLEAHGLNILLEIMKLDLAQQQAVRAGVTISDQDIQDETNITLIAFKKVSNQESLATGNAFEPSTQPSDDTLTPDERDRQLNLLLNGEKITQTEFNLAMNRNAIIRKLVTPIA